MTPARRAPRIHAFATAIGVVAVLYLAQDVLVPLALAALVSFCLAPVTTRLQPWIGRIPAVIAAVLLACAILGGITWLLAGQVAELARMVPQYRENITAKLSALQGGVVEEATDAVKEIEKEVQEQRAKEKLAEQREKTAEQDGVPVVPDAEATSPIDTVGAPPAPRNVPAAGGSGAATGSGEAEPPLRVEVVEEAPTSIELIAGAFGPLLSPLAFAGIVIVLVIFMLLARQDLRDRIVRLVGRSRIGLTTQALDEAGQRVSRYLLMQTAVNAITGVAVALGMFVLGVPGFLLWGLLSAVLRFVPYIGPWIAAAMPVMVALAVFDDWTSPLLVIGCFVVIELISNNALEPWLYGASAGVSPLAVIVTAIFWTWLWGPVGLLLATPITVCLVVMGKYVPQMNFVNILLGDQPVLDPCARFYQRLVAHEVDQAVEVAEEVLAQHGSLVDTFDEVLLPALALVETDRATEEFEDERAAEAQATLREVIDQLVEVAARRDAPGETAPPPGLEQRGERSRDSAPQPKLPELPVLPADLRVLVLPANDEADELAGLMLQHVVRAYGGTCEVIASAELSDGLVDVVQQHPADVVLVSAVPPSAVAHARHVHKRVRARFPDLPLLVGLWLPADRLERVQSRLGIDDQTLVVGTMRDALQAIAVVGRAARQTPNGHAAAPAGAPADSAAADG